MRLIVGQSDDVVAVDAVAAAIEMCDAQLSGLSPVAALVFASSSYEHADVLAGVARRWPGLPIVGCSTDGEMSSASGHHDDSVIVGLLVPWSEHTALSVETGSFKALSQDIDGSVESVMKQVLREDEQPKLIFVFTNPFAGDLQQLARRIHDRVECSVLGGGAGDHRTTLGPPGPVQFVGEEVLDDGLVVMAVYGDVLMGEGVATGWQPIGPSYTVTRAEGPLVFEVDGEPVLEKFKEFYCDDGIAVLGSAPLEVSHAGERYMRAVFEVDRDAGFAAFGGAVPEGSKVRVTEVLRGGVVDGTRRSVGGALEHYPGVAPQGVFLVHCAASKWVMGTRAADATQAVDEQVQGLPWMGFYAFGEMATHDSGVRFHNHTCCSMVFGAA